MYRKFNLVIIFTVTCFLTGCSVNSGNAKLARTNNEEVKCHFVKGKTTEIEIKELFGEPDDTDIMIDGKVKWIYTHIKRSDMARNYIPVVNWFSLGTNDTNKKLVLLFKNGVLVDFSLSTSKGETTIGILH